MTIIERLSIATLIIVATFGIGGILFMLKRSFAVRFVKRFEGNTIPKYWLAVVLGYPVTVVYTFAIYPPAGFILLLPLFVILLFPEIIFVNWNTVPSVLVPETVKLTTPIRRVGDRLETRVRIDGEDWTAEFFEDGLAPPTPGDVVRIVERKGLKLVIARAEQY